MTSSNEIVFQYENTPIHFLNSESVMINATEMAKPFGKRPVDWLRLGSTIGFLQELSTVRKSHSDDLVKVVNGGTAPGTWMHKDVALEFARWLAPRFSIWCNDRIIELLTTGKTEIKEMTDDEKIFESYRILENRIEAYKQQNKLLHTTIQTQAPMVEYYKDVLQSTKLILTTVIAKELGMSPAALNKALHEKRILYKAGETWVLYSAYQNEGFTGTKTHTYTDSFGRSQTSIQTYWTEKGREFIFKLLRAA